jgi:Mce-associated membrane protein
MALALTNVDYQTVDSDVQRILDNATGVFYDDFKNRSAAFAQTVRDAQATSTGTVTEASLESYGGGAARVLVVASSTTTNAGKPIPGPRVWRIRITVQKTGDTYKASNIEFLP